ncbi:hypothetical protein Slala03_78000 [Streptomyces lavendulae subsp. lavendulae]|uniref:hypothetical protein n=1 Tax=Streptomyces lavendulae TaxID=1914 RepID=UPI0024A0466D|nr:hypothetical protein [Streptomyces lavendulae]GLV88111.1 hypothetical protein Slala03_78000 [Streptomyces lavendulae subsp. lavendulae]
MPVTVVRRSTPSATTTFEWLPPSPDALCRYGAEWTAAKLRWGLAVDVLERDRLLDIAAGCGGAEVGFTPAP